MAKRRKKPEAEPQAEPVTLDTLRAELAEYPSPYLWAEVPAEHWIKRLQAGERPWTLSRFGDGEYNAMMGGMFWALKNCDGSPYTEALQADLLRCLTEPLPYYYGHGGGRQQKAYDAFRAEKGVDVPWVYMDTLKNLNHAGEFGPVLHALAQHRCVLVGPENMRTLPHNVLDPVSFVQVPQRFAHEQHERLVAETLAAVEATKADCVCISAGMAACVMIHKLWPELGQKCFLLDWGSVWDPYVGEWNRVVWRRLVREGAANGLLRRNIDTAAALAKEGGRA